MKNTLLALNSNNFCICKELTCLNFDKGTFDCTGVSNKSALGVYIPKHRYLWNMLIVKDWGVQGEGTAHLSPYAGVQLSVVQATPLMCYICIYTMLLNEKKRTVFQTNTLACYVYLCGLSSAVSTKFLMNKDFSGCIYSTATVNVINLNILCRYHLRSKTTFHSGSVPMFKPHSSLYNILPVPALLQHTFVDWVHSLCPLAAPLVAGPPAWLHWSHPSASAPGSPSPPLQYGAPPGRSAAWRKEWWQRQIIIFKFVKR